MISFKKQNLFWTIAFIVQCISLSANDICLHSKKIKLYTFYTPSHEIFFNDWFLPSVKQFDEYEVMVKRCNQECPNAEFMASGWTKTILHKVDLILDAIAENWGSVFIYSDVDIQFFDKTCDDILSALGNKDLVFQRDNTRNFACTGFFACRSNQKTLDLWKAVEQYMIDSKGVCSDQESLNHVIREKRFASINWATLPITFFGGGTLTSKLWVPGASLPIPLGIKIHHANWTRGIDNKVAQLQYVKSIVISRK